MIDDVYRWCFVAAMVGLFILVTALRWHRALQAPKPPKVPRPLIDPPDMWGQFTRMMAEENAKFAALVAKQKAEYPEKLRAHEEREWARLESCPICDRPDHSSKYAHVGPRDTRVEQILTCISGHTWSRRRRLEGEPPGIAPVPPRDSSATSAFRG
ncbi:MAG: hypothetical protein WC718_15270 [Phycisphaerales bacterium]|jgi:hypothetical protein